MAGNPTITTVILRMNDLQRAQDEMRTLVLEVLKQMITISQVQAESNLRFLALVEEQSQAFRLFQAVGPGSSRNQTESDEAAQWRAELAANAAEDAKSGTDIEFRAATAEPF